MQAHHGLPAFALDAAPGQPQRGCGEAEPWGTRARCPGFQPISEPSVGRRYSALTGPDNRLCRVNLILAWRGESPPT